MQPRTIKRLALTARPVFRIYHIYDHKSRECCGGRAVCHKRLMFDNKSIMKISTLKGSRKMSDVCFVYTYYFVMLKKNFLEKEEMYFCLLP